MEREIKKGQFVKSSFKGRGRWRKCVLTLKNGVIPDKTGMMMVMRQRSFVGDRPKISHRLLRTILACA